MQQRTGSRDCPKAPIHSYTLALQWCGLVHSTLLLGITLSNTRPQYNPIHPPLLNTWYTWYLVIVHYY